MVRIRYKRRTGKVKYESFGDVVPSGALAHLMLVGAGGWSLRYVVFCDTPYAFTCLAFLFSHGLLGSIKFGYSAGPGDNVENTYAQTDFLAEIFPIPLITTQFYLLCGKSLLSQPSYAFFPIISALFPLIAQHCDQEKVPNEWVIDAVLAGNTIALGYIGYTCDSQWIQGLAAISLLNNFLFKKFGADYELEKNTVGESSCVAHMMLVGTSGWTLRYLEFADHPYAYGCIAFLFAHGVLGTIKFGVPDFADSVASIYEQTELMAEAIPVPLFTTQLYYVCGKHLLPDPGFAIFPAIAAGFPILTQFCDQEKLSNDWAIDLVLGMNIIGMAHLGYKVQSVWIGALAAFSFMHHFSLKKSAPDYEIEKNTAVTLGLTFFCIFAMNALCECSIAK